MFIFLQYCKISRVSHLCRDTVSDSYVINYNFLYRPFSIEIDATSFLSKEMLNNCTAHTLTHTDLCKWKGKGSKKKKKKGEFSH